LTPNELVLTFRGSYVCANYGENRSGNATVRVLADRQTHRHTDANRFYNLSHAICYSYGTDNYAMHNQHRIVLMFFPHILRQSSHLKRFLLERDATPVLRLHIRYRVTAFCRSIVALFYA